MVVWGCVGVYGWWYGGAWVSMDDKECVIIHSNKYTELHCAAYVLKSKNEKIKKYKTLMNSQNQLEF